MGTAVASWVALFNSAAAGGETFRMSLPAPSALLVETPYRTWDVIVVGAGLAGALAAYDLARRGLAVLMVDKAAFPRWKVCGSCLNPPAPAGLAACGFGDLLPECGPRPAAPPFPACL